MIKAKTCDKILSFVNTKVENILVTPIFTSPSASGLGPTACKLFYSQTWNFVTSFSFHQCLYTFAENYFNKLMKFELAGAGVHR